MKKLFAIGFMMILFLMTSFIPDNTVTLDDDVGISYVIGDQVQTVNYVIEVPAIGESQYSCTQEKISISGDCYFISAIPILETDMAIPAVGLRQSWQSSINVNNDNTSCTEYVNSIQLLTTITRLDIGENYSRQNIG